MQVFNVLVFSGKRYLTGLSKCVKKGRDGQFAESPLGDGKMKRKRVID